MQKSGQPGPVVCMPSRHRSKPSLFGQRLPTESSFPPSHFSSLLPGSLTRLSNFSSFAISTSGPFFASWPFFSCKETKQDRTVSRKESRNEEGSNTWRAAGVQCLSSHPSLEPHPQRDAPAHPHISSLRCHEMCETPVSWERTLMKCSDGNGCGSVDPQ